MGMQARTLHREETINLGHTMTLDGWGEISTHMEVVTGITRSERTIRRWAGLGHDPLPVRRTPGGRDVIADSLELEAWWDRSRERMSLLTG
jgi:hypothetical protein